MDRGIERALKGPRLRVETGEMSDHAKKAYRRCGTSNAEVDHLQSARELEAEGRSSPAPICSSLGQARRQARLGVRGVCSCSTCHSG